jgi:hypothetical protein
LSSQGSNCRPAEERAHLEAGTFLKHRSKPRRSKENVGFISKPVMNKTLHVRAVATTDVAAMVIANDRGRRANAPFVLERRNAGLWRLGSVTKNPLEPGI